MNQNTNSEKKEKEVFPVTRGHVTPSILLIIFFKYQFHENTMEDTSENVAILMQKDTHHMFVSDSFAANFTVK